MVRHPLKILQQLLQDFKSVSDHFGSYALKGYKVSSTNFIRSVLEYFVSNLT